MVSEMCIRDSYHDGAIWMREGDQFEQHFGETRAQRIQEFHQHNNRPVIGLWEGAFLRWENESGILIGGDATVFSPQTESVTYPQGTIFGPDLITRPC